VQLLHALSGAASDRGMVDYDSGTLMAARSRPNDDWGSVT